MKLRLAAAAALLTIGVMQASEACTQAQTTKCYSVLAKCLSVYGTSQLAYCRGAFNRCIAACR